MTGETLTPNSGDRLERLMQKSALKILGRAAVALSGVSVVFAVLSSAELSAEISANSDSFLPTTVQCKLIRSHSVAKDEKKLTLARDTKWIGFKSIGNSHRLVSENGQMQPVTMLRQINFSFDPTVIYDDRPGQNTTSVFVWLGTKFKTGNARVPEWKTRIPGKKHGKKLDLTRIKTLKRNNVRKARTRQIRFVWLGENLKVKNKDGKVISTIVGLLPVRDAKRLQKKCKSRKRQIAVVVATETPKKKRTVKRRAQNSKQVQPKDLTASIVIRLPGKTIKRVCKLPVEYKNNSFESILVTLQNCRPKANMPDRTVQVQPPEQEPPVATVVPRGTVLPQEEPPVRGQPDLPPVVVGEPAPVVQERVVRISIKPEISLFGKISKGSWRALANCQFNFRFRQDAGDLPLKMSGMGKPLRGKLKLNDRDIEDLDPVLKVFNCPDGQEKDLALEAIGSGELDKLQYSVILTPANAIALVVINMRAIPFLEGTTRQKIKTVKIIRQIGQAISDSFEEMARGRPFLAADAIYVNDLISVSSRSQKDIANFRKLQRTKNRFKLRLKNAMAYAGAPQQITMFDVINGAITPGLMGLRKTTGDSPLKFPDGWASSLMKQNRYPGDWNNALVTAATSSYLSLFGVQARLPGTAVLGVHIAGQSVTPGVLRRWCSVAPLSEDIVARQLLLRVVPAVSDAALTTQTGFGLRELPSRFSSLQTKIYQCVGQGSNQDVLFLPIDAWEFDRDEGYARELKAMVSSVIAKRLKGNN
jgi:hypothetical protein